jgi:O-acetylhomoserine/O-acetylserine sulfhydrylase-like pyridoxal-dependent enzyme
MQNPSNKSLVAIPNNLPEATSPGDYELNPLRAFRAIPRLRCAPWSVIQFATATFVKVDLARKYLPKGVEAVFTFGVTGGYEVGIRLGESVQLVSHLANIGDTRSLILHPASTTHRQLSDKRGRSVGAGPDLVRPSIGLVSADHLICDLDQALSGS